jgi:SAM-dependent methyltransferase
MHRTQSSEIIEQTITLQHVGEIESYNNWVFSSIRDHIQGRVLEVGSGIGTYSTHLRPLASELTCIDMIPEYIHRVETLFHGDHAVHTMLAKLGNDLHFRPASFDTIVCLNVLEHIKEEGEALSYFRDWLAPGGKLVLQVPAHEWLFGSMDEALEHQRRYTRASAKKALLENGFELVLPPKYLYMAAAPGWWWVGKVRKSQVVPEATIRFANAVVSISRGIEAIIPAPFGLTLIAVGRVKGKS